MTWITDKSKLGYYTTLPEFCYCDTVSYASDILLQGKWNSNQLGFNYNASVEIWSKDGNTAYEVVNPIYYDLYYGKIPDTGEYFFTLRFKSFSPAMCDNKCFLVRVGISYSNVAPVTYVFAAWTEQYCIKSCCDSPRGVIVNGTEVTYTSDTAVISEAFDRCGHPMIRLIATSDCYNAFNGKYYGKPASSSGTYIPYFDITVIAGTIVQRPRPITKQVAFNGKIQRVESQRQYLLRGYEVFPTWKMAEIEDMAHGNHFYVDDFTQQREYEVSGTIFEKLGERVCAEIFRLNATVTDKVIRQNFGCVSSCDETDTGQFFVVPQQYAGGFFFDANGNIIANDPSELVQWFISQGLNAAMMSPVMCNVTAIIQVSGNPIPPVVYYDTTNLENQIVILTADFDDICDYISNAYCQAPVIGTITETDIICAAPDLGMITETDDTGTPFALYEESPWIMDMSASDGEISSGQATFRIKVAKDLAGALAEIVFVSSELIGSIDPSAVPSGGRVITSGNDVLGNISPGWYINVVPTGEIKFTGYVTFTEDDILRIQMTNLTYSL